MSDTPQPFVDNGDCHPVQPTSLLQPVDASQPWDTQEVDVIAKLDSLETSNSSPSTADARFSQMQLLLSLDIILELIHADRESLKRIETFKNYTGKYGRKVKDAIEEVFVLLLQAVGNRHIAPGFRMSVSWNKTSQIAFLKSLALQGYHANGNL